MALERETATYRRAFAELMQLHAGRFVLIAGDQIIGVHDRYEDALKTGYEQFGLSTHFMVKRIETTERAQFVFSFFRGIPPLSHG